MYHPAMPRSSDLADLFVAPTRSARAVALAERAEVMRYRQGIVTAWNPLTLENRVRVSGVELENLPVIGLSEASVIRVGVTVALRVVGTTWAIDGRWAVPGTEAASEALGYLSSRLYTNTVSASETVSTLTFTDLNTPGPTLDNVLISPSGRCLVILSATIESVGPVVRGGEMGFVVTGATSLPVSFDRALICGHVHDGVIDTGGLFSSNNRADGLAAVIPLTLNPGLHRFHAVYRSRGGAGADFSVRFSNRTLTVLAL